MNEELAAILLETTVRLYERDLTPVHVAAARAFAAQQGVYLGRSTDGNAVWYESPDPRFAVGQDGRWPLIGRKYGNGGINAVLYIRP